MFSKFIAFEGLDGSGKDTAIEAISKLFYQETSPLYISKYQNLLRTREPTINSPMGKEIAAKLLNGDILNDPKEEVTQLYIDDRKNHCIFIREALKNNIIVLSSRYDLSNYAYQMMQGIDFDWIYQRHHYRLKKGCLIPDLTLFFRVSPEIALKRVCSRRTPKEAFETLSLLKKINDFYEIAIEKLVQRDKRIIIEIDAAQDIETVIQNTVMALAKYITTKPQ